MGPYMLVFSVSESGTVYYYHSWVCEKGISHWTVTEDRDKADRFKTKNKCLNRYREVHSFPEDYEYLIRSGVVRAEPVNQPGIPFTIN